MTAKSHEAYDLFENELGWGLGVAVEGRLVRLSHVDSEEKAQEVVRREHPGSVRDGTADPFPELWRQLEEYLAGERRRFDLPLAPEGTGFQRSVWRALQEIPYGETRSYAELAATLGNPGGSRAVGQANKHNPLGIVIPCHRVIAGGGGLGGYAGGIWRKEKLLELEGVFRQEELEWEG